MLQITIPSVEKYDPATNMFYTTKEYQLTLEHSLISVSKWESKWNKPFLGKEQKTTEESIDYIRCMTLTSNIDDEAYKNITPAVFKKINAYIDAPMTATTFSSNAEAYRPKNHEIITAELIYYWMIGYGIPFECQKWHLNKLLTLIRVCDIKNQPAKKMGKNEILSRNRELNAARRAAMNTRG